MKRAGPWKRLLREKKAIKEWKRAWKIRLIEQSNPDWRNLYEEIVGWTLAFASVTDPKEDRLQKTVRRNDAKRNLAEVSHHDQR